MYKYIFIQIYLNMINISNKIKTSEKIIQL